MYILHLHSYLSIKNLKLITYIPTLILLSYSGQKLDKILTNPMTMKKLTSSIIAIRMICIIIVFFQCELYMLHAETTIIL